MNFQKIKLYVRFILFSLRNNAKVYERTDNAYKNATHFFFNIGVPDVPRTGWESMGDTFEGTKLREGVQSASDHQNFVTLELVSIHN